MQNFVKLILSTIDSPDPCLREIISKSSLTPPLANALCKNRNSFSICDQRLMFIGMFPNCIEILLYRYLTFSPVLVEKSGEFMVPWSNWMSWATDSLRLFNLFKLFGSATSFIIVVQKYFSEECEGWTLGLHYKMALAFTVEVMHKR